MLAKGGGGIHHYIFPVQVKIEITLMVLITQQYSVSCNIK